jgi:type I restriction-modification system DNA methylase subunit
MKNIKIPSTTKKTKENNEPLEAKLWKAADTLRKNIDAADINMLY